MCCRTHPLSCIHTPATLGENEQKNKREMPVLSIDMQIYDFLGSTQRTYFYAHCCNTFLKYVRKEQKTSLL